MKADALSAVVSGLTPADRPMVSGMSRFLAPSSQGGFDGRFSREAIDTVYELMVEDLKDRSDGSGRYRPSLLGQPCLRKIMLSYHGIDQLPFTPDGIQLVNAGTWRHYYWQAAGLTAGFLVDIERKLYLNGVFYSQADGIGEDGRLFEFKSTRYSVYNKWVLDEARPKPEHLLQIHGAMRAGGMTTASLVYEDRDNMRRHEFVVKYSQSVENELLTKLRVLDSHRQAGTLPPMLDECSRGVGTMFKDCQWRESCPKASLRGDQS